MRAVTIDAPPDKIWPWIMQIGRDRGGFYSYTWLENLIGADIHNVHSRAAPGHARCGRETRARAIRGPTVDRR